VSDMQRRACRKFTVQRNSVVVYGHHPRCCMTHKIQAVWVLKRRGHQEFAPKTKQDKTKHEFLVKRVVRVVVSTFNVNKTWSGSRRRRGHGRGRGRRRECGDK